MSPGTANQRGLVNRYAFRSPVLSVTCRREDAPWAANAARLLGLAPSAAGRLLLGPLSAGTDDWPLSATVKRGAVRKYL